MNEVELNKICSVHKHTKYQFLGVYAVDELIKLEIDKKPSFLLANTDYSDEEGSHWVLIYINSFPTPPIWFDSIGKKPIEYNIIFDNFLKRNGALYLVNTKRYQHTTSISCGQFCLYVADLLCVGENFSSILKRFDSKNLIKNDKLVDYYFNHHMMDEL